MLRTHYNTSLQILRPLNHLKEQQNFARWVTAVQPQPVIVIIQTYIMGYTDAVAQASPLFPRTVF